MSAPDPFHVPWLTHALGTLVEDFPSFFLGLGRLETALLAEQLAHIRIDRPVFVCGLARGGTTLLHLALAGRRGVATHRARDYPLVYTPYWTRQATAGMKPSPPRERTHGDRIHITSDSPEALEEMLWMVFFPRCHDPTVSCVLDGRAENAAFEHFYTSHLKKLLLAEGATRYAAKANYHVARLGYLLRLFPDARFILPFREPVAHIASLVRQQEHFSKGERRQPRALAHMRRAGHFEFGLDRRPMNLGDTEQVRDIQWAWARGDLAGWARYWAMVQDYLADTLAASEALRSACLVVKYETLCDDPVGTLGEVFRHCGLAIDLAELETFAATVSRPDYYASPFSPAEVEQIRRETASAAGRWGYG
jgi:hypothetical protein